MKRVFSAFLFLWIVASTVAAQDFDLDDYFQWDVKLSQTEVAPGGQVFVEFTLTIAPEHITYRKRLKLAAEAPEGITAGEPVLPEAHVKPDPITGEEVEIDEGTVTYKLPLNIPVETPLGVYPIEALGRYQGCSKTVCYFPNTTTFPLALMVTDSVEAADTVNTGTATPPETVKTEDIPVPTTVSRASKNDLQGLLSQSYLLAFLAVYAAGLLTSFTPCVYPLIPITVSIFGARNAQTKLEGFMLAATYVLGIVIMYSALGFAAAKTGAVFGQFMSNPWVLGTVAVVFAAMGLSMFGLFELQLPSSWQAKLAGAGGKGYGSALFMGLICGIIAAPCTGPMLVAILAIVAQQANPTLGLLLLMIYALGLGTLFLLIGTFSGMISKLPKSGGWMENVKSVFGIILFAFVLYYLDDVIPFLKTLLNPNTVTYSIATILFLVGITLGAVHLSYHSPQVSVRFRKTVGVVFSTFALYLIIGSATMLQASNLQWVRNIDEGLALAKQENKPVMIDFWADWCIECKEIEAFTFTDPRVSERLKDFITIKVDLTEETPENDQVRAQYGISGLPWIMFMDSNGNVLDEKRIVGFIDEDDFMDLVGDIR